MNDRIFAGFTTVLVILTGSVISAQTSSEPFPSPNAASEDVITVGIAEFASLPDVNGEAARMMHFVDEPGTERLFISDMRGLLYSVSYDGQTVTRYLDLTAEAWGLSVEATGRERGFQSFAFHPEFDHPGSPGFGRFYTYFDTSNTIPTPDFVPGGDDSAQDTMLVEWTAETPGAATYDGSPPRVLMRIEQPFRNHNGGQIGFNPLASPGDADFGLLYVGSADGGSGGDPLDLAQNTGSVFGKILRIDPLVWAHLSRRRIRACQPTAPIEVSGHRCRGLPSHRDSPAGEPGAVWRHPQRRNLLHPGRSATRRRAKHHPPGPARRWRRTEDPASTCPGQEHRTRQAPAQRADVRFGTGQRNRNCQPSVWLTVSYWRLLTNETHGLGCALTTLRTNWVEKEPSDRSIWFHSLSRLSARPDRGRMPTLSNSSRRFPEKKLPHR